MSFCTDGVYETMNDARMEEGLTEVENCLSVCVTACMCTYVCTQFVCTHDRNRMNCAHTQTHFSASVYT